MDKLDKNDLQKFIEDTYVYLNNQQAISNETYENDITDQYSIKNLLQRCKRIMDKLRHEIDNDNNNAANTSNVDDALEDDCYLEMNSKLNDNEYMTFCSNNTNNNNNGDEDDKNDLDTQSITNVDEKLLDNDDDIDDNGDSIQCPYSGLPAAHLIIKNSPKCGFINRVGKRLFFEQNKKYYAGILTKWLLLYPNGTSDLKPTTYLYINKTITIDNLSETNKKKLYLFQINYFNNKKYLFQTQTEKDLMGWIKILNEVREINYRDEISVMPTHGLSIRKLPTPPPDTNHLDSPSTKNGDDNNSIVLASVTDHSEIQRTSNRSEDIYEEPKSLFDYNNLSVCDNKMICYVNGKRIEYDIPKSQPVSPPQTNQNTPERKTSNSNVTTTDTVQNDETYELIELSKVREKIENELILLKEKPKLPAKKKLFETCTSQQTTITTSTSGRTPVKQWFKNRLTLSSSKETTHILSISSPKLMPPPVKSPSKMKQNVSGIGGVEKSPPKGAKINMIINQLEANGHLPLISKNLNERRNTMLYEDYITVGK